MNKNAMVVVDGLPGWEATHPRYGKWFISRAAVVEDWKQDYEQAFPGKPVPEPTDDVVDVWLAEQISWIEVAARGKQLERPDMAAVEAEFLRQMAGDGDYFHFFRI